MKKKLISIFSVFCIAASLNSCGNNEIESSSLEEPSVVETTAEKTTEKTTTQKTTTTEAKMSVYDAADEIRNELSDKSSYQVHVYSDDTIYIFNCFEGANKLLNHCRSNLNFSYDYYELWLDLKSNLKSESEILNQLYPEYNITIYLLDDKENSLPINDNEEYSYLASFSNGYCLYDASDN